MNGSDTSEIPKIKASLVVELIVSVAIVIMNIMSVAALSRCVKMDRRISIMIKNIALADTLLGFCPVNFAIGEQFHLFKIMLWCYFVLIFNRVTVLMKMFSVSILAVDRFSCLYFSTWYLKYVDKTVTTKVSLIAWTTALGMALATYVRRLSLRLNCFHENKTMGFGLMIALGLLCGTTILVAYTGVFLNIRKHEKYLKLLNISTGSSKRTLYRSTIKLCLLMLVFVVCYTPSGLYRTSVYLNPEFQFNTETFRHSANVIFLMSSIINPLLYVWRFTECRLKLLEIVFRCNRKKIENLQKRQRDIFAFNLQTN
ncbi:Adrenocorticotropic hormone receptor [Mizuhopecten yessoensis]|uniref:Adrenocorticotropic hormone receptor n=1 Tax=Mizuhopecten yessoensis TaxID=6573 RepID=A0A210PRL4_MIZYE|nr:Adrenocorticotropic hormone receptor [Mizuhopecten yessoensis]